jgi:DNA repair exonuclease SbcCD ATPase subunit
VTADVEETLRSAMVDEAAGRALATGLLTDTFSATGIDPVDLTRVVALPAAGLAAAPARSPRRTDDEVASDAERQRLVEAAKKTVAQTDSALAAAAKTLKVAGHAVADATDQHDRLVSERDELRRRLAELEARVGEAAEELDAARRDRGQAERVEAEARAAAERAHEGLDDLLG